MSRVHTLSSRGITMNMNNLLLQCLFTVVILHSQSVLIADENKLHLYTSVEVNKYFIEISIYTVLILHMPSVHLLVSVYFNRATA